MLGHEDELVEEIGSRRTMSQQDPYQNIRVLCRSEDVPISPSLRRDEVCAARSRAMLHTSHFRIHFSG